MKRISALSITLFVFAFILLTSCPKEQTTQDSELEKRESIFDRVVHIELELITEIPEVFRWCDRLDLKKHRINVGDAELHVEEEGKGTPLVLINGGPGGTHHYFHPWFSNAKDYARVIYYDQRGCGLSDFEPGKDGYSVQQAVRDLDATRKALNIEKWVVLGYSYGGFLAQYYTINHPENVSGLILLGATPGMWVKTGPSRQNEFLSDEERNKKEEIRKQLNELDKEKDLSRKKYIQLLIYNNFINGDWKCQHFYKPSPERMAQAALYEWDHDNNFNGIMNSSANRVDMTGAFDINPIPTLILEGKWDLTWSEKKAEILKENHPNARMVIFENAGHGIYDEETDKFFSVLEEFVKTLPEISSSDVNEYKDLLIEWEKNRKASPDYIMETTGWGRNSSKNLAKAYTRKWLNRFDKPRNFLRIGFALYDFEKYEEALFVFEKMKAFAETQKEKEYRALALIWQGHMLDLMGKRQEAVTRYQQVVDMNISDSWQHDQYGLRYKVSPYAKERIKEPFKRIENQNPD